jgi:hypothetical protein
MFPVRLFSHVDLDFFIGRSVEELLYGGVNYNRHADAWAALTNHTPQPFIVGVGKRHAEPAASESVCFFAWHLVSPVFIECHPSVKGDMPFFWTGFFATVAWDA